MNDYETLQKLAYGLIAIMLIFNFLGSAVVYEQEIDDDSGGATFTYYLDEVELKDEYAEDSVSHNLFF